MRGTDTSTKAKLSSDALEPFQRFVDELIRRPAVASDPNEALGHLIPVAVRRQAGAYFTSPGLARELVQPYAEDLRGSPTVLDPTCGAGDLLIAAAQHFETVDDPERRLEVWSRQIRGRDLFEEFVHATRLRIYLAARGASDTIPSLAELFPHLEVGSGLSATEMYGAASHILLNPPYTLVSAPESCEWRRGRVSAAALFVERAAKEAQTGTRIAAILPDVLRSGSGYEKWRRMLADHLLIEGVKVEGRFASWADVDVFLLHGRVRSSRRPRRSTGWGQAREPSSSVGDRFDISVGPVVDYRSPKKGAWHPYLTVDQVPPWDTFSAGAGVLRRRFSGTLFTPPFVLVRRTSRFEDKFRAVATLVVGTAPVAVENHLLVLVPRKGTLAECSELMEVLRDPGTTECLNARIRCRHLTVGALRDLPWPRR